MGDYNPHAPNILGMEWVPIRDASYLPDQITERGYSFRLNNDSAMVSGAFYVKEQPPKSVTNIAEMIYVYPAGREHETGPIRKVTIPVSSVTTTGFGGTATGDAASVANPSDDLFLRFNSFGVGNPSALLNFAVESYTQELFGKRILDVRLVYTAGGALPGDLDDTDVLIAKASDVFSTNSPWQGFLEGPADDSGAALSAVTDFKYIDFGDTNILLDPFMIVDRSALALPWRYQELLWFSTVTPLSTRRGILIDTTNFVDTVLIGYAALEVFYCEETRVRYGGRVVDATTGFGRLELGPNMVQLRDVNFNFPSALPAGEYVVTYTHRELKPTFIARAAPTVHAIRQLYELPSHRGIEVDARVIEDAEFVSETVDELSQITLHTASTIVTGVHPYGKPIGAPVYGSISATQEIEDDPGPTSSTQFPQVRFYARRFGDTTVPLKLADVATGLSTVSISPSEFDELPEIVDGWREVTLRFTTVPTFSVTAGAPSWRWTAVGELASNQWQILGADGPSFTGAQRIGPATYWSPFGDTVSLTWKSPSISGTADDTNSDAVLIFSQDPPSVTGFTVTQASQELSVARHCDLVPNCIPTALTYNHLAWTYVVACDTFNREETGTWGTPNVGPDWSASVSSATVSVADGLGKIQHNAASSSVALTLDVNAANVDITFKNMGWPVVPVGANPVQIIRARFVDANNYVQVEIYRGGANDIAVRIVSRTGGVDTATGFISVANNLTAITTLNVRFQALIGSNLRVKVWQSGTAEPYLWTAQLAATHTAAGDVLFIQDISTVTNTFPITTTIGSITVAASAAQDNTYLELQRYDSVDGEWQTIMQSTDPCVDQFDDYEARVGVESQYRIRACNALDFCGAWVTGSGTIPTPGVVGVGDGNSILIFTSNVQPDSNLAYVMQFEGQPIETFVFPEVDTVQLQRLFGKDFFTAFHPLERGGEQFTRTVLVNAAAIAPASLANFRGLRDLAWASLDYVCVRDELGNRWFANVLVPEGEVRQNRTIYLAQIRVTEVTNTPTPVDPEVLS